jgi:hypothetical protein
MEFLPQTWNLAFGYVSLSRIAGVTRCCSDSCSDVVFVFFYIIPKSLDDEMCPVRTPSILAATNNLPLRGRYFEHMKERLKVIPTQVTLSASNSARNGRHQTCNGSALSLRHRRNFFSLQHYYAELQCWR